MIYKISEIENKLIDIAEPVEICLEDGVYRSVRFSESVQKVTFTGGKAKCGFVFGGEQAVMLVLKNCGLSGMLGQPAIKKEKGELAIVISGNNELRGCNASFGPSSFGESPAVVADKLTVCKQENSTLLLHGGRTFASLFKEKVSYCSALLCNEIAFNKE